MSDTVRVFGYYNRKRRPAGHSLVVGDHVIYSKAIGKSSHQVSYKAVIKKIFKMKITIEYELDGKIRTVHVTHGTLRKCSDQKEVLVERSQKGPAKGSRT